MSTMSIGTRRAVVTVAAAFTAAGVVATVAPAATAAPATRAGTFAIKQIAAVSGVEQVAVQDDTHDVVAAVRDRQEPYGTHIEVFHQGKVVSNDYLGARSHVGTLDSADRSQVWFTTGADELWLRTRAGLKKVATPTAPNGSTRVTAIHDVRGPEVVIAVGATVYRGQPGRPWTSLGGPGGTPADSTHPVPITAVHGIDSYQGTLFAWGIVGPGARKTAFTFDGTTWTRGKTVNENYGPLTYEVYLAFVPMGNGRIEGFGSTQPRGGDAKGLHASFFGRNRSYGISAPIDAGTRVGDTGILLNDKAVYQIRHDGTSSKVAGGVPGYQIGNSVVAASDDGSFVVAGTSTGLYTCGGPAAR